MASESVMNGTYAPQNGYGSIEQNHTGYAANSYQAPASAPSASASNNAAVDIPKDEVGWYFVEQYYTTLSRSPEKVYLFYNKRSQFVSGNETEKVAVCVGQRAINDRIKELDFHDCKVRVTNVDSQASDDHIVIQVIGEISNKSAPHKKFTQTFVLAAQTNGYFVLNDIFRYIIDEEDEAEPEADEAAAGVHEPAPTAAQEPEPETMTSSEDPAAVEQDASKVDKEIEEKLINQKPSEEDTAAPPAAVEGSPKIEGADVAHAEEAPAAAVSSTEPEVPAAEEPAVAVAATQESLEPEKPKDPEPTPARSPVKQAAQPAQAEKPAAPKPSGPKTWANLAAAAHRVATPAVPVPQPSSSAAAPQPKTAPVPAQAQTTPAAASSPAAAPTPAAAAREPSPSASQQDEWTSVGDKRQQNKAQAGANAQEGPQHRAYIKNVNEGVDAKQLRAAIEKYGEIAYLDISRTKNCAFVDFKTAEGYKAVMDANPHQVGSHSVVVEERRMKPGSYPYVPRGGARGGRGGSNQPSRGSYQGGRGGSQRGRGGNASRARGGAQGA